MCEKQLDTEMVLVGNKCTTDMKLRNNFPLISMYVVSQTEQNPEGLFQMQRTIRVPCLLFVEKLMSFSSPEAQKSTFKQSVIRTIESQNLRFLPKGHRHQCLMNIAELFYKHA